MHIMNRKTLLPGLALVIALVAMLIAVLHRRPATDAPGVIADPPPTMAPETVLPVPGTDPEPSRIAPHRDADPAPEEDIAPVVVAVTTPDHPRRKWFAVYELPGARSATETDRLISYLTDNPIGAYEYLGEEFAHRNYIMDVLREQRHAWPLVVNALAQVYAEPRQGDVLRGYALQHLASLYIDNPETLGAAQRTGILAVLRSALPLRGPTALAATALVGLHEIARVDRAAVADTEVEQIALDLLADPEAGDLARISALQIAGERRLTAAVPAARDLAADPQADWVVRMAAAWLLGQTGADPALLATLTADPDENVRHAARAALSRKEP